MQKPIKIKIDTVADCSVEIDKNIVKGDTLLMTINVYQETASLNLSNQEIHIIIKTSDGYTIEMKSGNPLMSVNNGQIIAQFKGDYLATGSSGRAIGEIHLIDSDGDDITNKFYFDVDATLADDIVVKSQDKIDTLIEINETIADYNLNADYLSEQNNLAIQNKADLQTLNDNADSLTEKLKTDIANGIDIAEKLENDTVTGNQLDSNLNQSFIQGNSLLASLLSAISNGNYTLSQFQGLDWNYISSMFNLLELAFKGSRLTDENGNYFIDENGNYLTM